MDAREADNPLISDYSDIDDHYAEFVDTSLVEPVIARPAPTSIIDAIQHYLDDVQSGHEYTPDQIGLEKGFRRRLIINSALALALAKAARRCKRNSTFIGPILFYISAHSDNEFGRCTDGARRISEYAGCGEDVVRDLRDALVVCGALRAERSSDNGDRRRTGKSIPVWLPYIAEAVLHSDFAILNALAPPRLAGRPRKTSGTVCPTIIEKTSGTMGPTISEKRRAFDLKTSGVLTENIGHLMPDNNNSIHTLSAGLPAVGSVFTPIQIADWQKLLGSEETSPIVNLLSDELNAAWPLCRGEPSILHSAALATLAEAKRQRPTRLQGFVRSVLRSQIDKLINARQSTLLSNRRRRASRW
ncbi:hypothetical protein [Hyphomicrobium sp. 2TAF46]|uniref:hypothetical protein n=1 Tax=Hyphomicrobium sp. 2TAF46 TaxID=3233019 RepID=UPI003F9165FD